MILARTDPEQPRLIIKVSPSVREWAGVAKLRERGHTKSDERMPWLMFYIMLWHSTSEHCAPQPEALIALPQYPYPHFTKMGCSRIIHIIHNIKTHTQPPQTASRILYPDKVNPTLTFSFSPTSSSHSKLDPAIHVDTNSGKTILTTKQQSYFDKPYLIIMPLYLYSDIRSSPPSHYLLIMEDLSDDASSRPGNHISSLHGPTMSIGNVRLMTEREERDAITTTSTTTNNE